MPTDEAAERAPSDFELRQRSFERAVPIIASVVLMLASALILILLDWEQRPFANIGALILIGLTSVTLTMSLRGRSRLAGYVLIFSCHVAVGALTVISQRPSELDVFAQVVFITLAGFFIGPRVVPAMVGFVALVIVLSNLSFFGRPDFVSAHLPLMISSLIFVGIIGCMLSLFSRRSAANLEELRARLHHNEELFERVPEAANKLGAAAQEISAMGQQQLAGVAQQSQAVDVTRDWFRSMLASSEQIAGSSQEALQHAATTLDKAQQMARKLELLAEHSKRIGDILETITELADKSDLLALNAALEGTRAGEAGLGFSLVAGQMQAHAERTAKAARDIKKLTADVQEATRETQLSTEETTALARLSREANRQINDAIQRQRADLGSVSSAMEAIAEFRNLVQAGNRETIHSTEELLSLAEQLTAVVEEFRERASR